MKLPRHMKSSWMQSKSLRHDSIKVSFLGRGHSNIQKGKTNRHGLKDCNSIETPDDKRSYNRKKKASALQQQLPEEPQSSLFLSSNGLPAAAAVSLRVAA